MNRTGGESAALLAEMCSGSAEAFEQFYERYMPLVYQVAMRVVGDRMEAEDVCHDVFLEVLRKGSGYDSRRGSIESWLAVMTRSRCLDRLRRQKRTTLLQESDTAVFRAGGEPGPEELVLDRMQREALVHALGHLPLRQRQAIVSQYYGNETQSTMSAALNVPLGTVKSWVRYGIHNIRKQFDKLGWMQETGIRKEEDK